MVPLVIKMTELAVFVYPVQGLQELTLGIVKFRPTKVVPPVPKPPLTAMQKGVRKRG
jgi:hypothetical protein